MPSPTSSKKKPPRHAMLNPRYRGYLKPHAVRISQLASEGKSPLQIARILFADGVRSPNDTGPDENGHRMDHVGSFTGLIYVLLGRRQRPKNFEEKLERRIARTRQLLRELEQQQQRGTRIGA
jgi:hypothetical protein